jgi:predicted nucleic acid-binding protein
MEPKIIILDTDVIIDWIIGNKLIEEVVTTHLCYINCITLAEVQQGAANKFHLNKINKALEILPVIEIDLPASNIFSENFEKYILSHQCSIPDMLIAATALRFDIEVFTFNTKHFAYIAKLRLFQHKINPLKKGGWL